MQIQKVTKFEKFQPVERETELRIKRTLFNLSTIKYIFKYWKQNYASTLCQLCFYPAVFIKATGNPNQQPSNYGIRSLLYILVSI